MSVRASTRFRKMMSEPGLIVAPGAYDGVSARLIENQGFKAVYMTGSGTSASVLGQPDIGLTTLTEMAAHAAHIAGCISLPVIADADTGYGNALNVVRTVREYERAGVAGIHLEDQVLPKRCGQLTGKQVISLKEFSQKIRAAVEYKTDPDFVIIARTDARAVNGLDDAIERANAYHQAGADIIFVEAPASMEEMERVAQEVKAPLLINMATGGVTPSVNTSTLERMGFKLAIYPTITIMAAVRAMEAKLAAFAKSGLDEPFDKDDSPLNFFKKIGIDWWLEVEKEYS